MSNICTGVAPLTIRILRFFVRFKLGEKEEENTYLLLPALPAIHTNTQRCNFVLFRNIKKVVFKKHSPRTRYTLLLRLFRHEWIFIPIFKKNETGVEKG